MFKKIFAFLVIMVTFSIGLLLLYRASLEPSDMTIVDGKVINKKIVSSRRPRNKPRYSLALQIDGREERLGIFLGTKAQAEKDSTIYLINISKTYTFYLDPTIRISNGLNNAIRRIDSNGRTIFLASNAFNLYCGLSLSLLSIIAAIIIYAFLSSIDKCNTRFSSLLPGYPGRRDEN